MAGGLERQAVRVGHDKREVAAALGGSGSRRRVPRHGSIRHGRRGRPGRTHHGCAGDDTGRTHAAQGARKRDTKQRPFLPRRTSDPHIKSVEPAAPSRRAQRPSTRAPPPHQNNPLPSSDTHTHTHTHNLPGAPKRTGQGGNNSNSNRHSPQQQRQPSQQEQLPSQQQQRAIRSTARGAEGRGLDGRVPHPTAAERVKTSPSAAAPRLLPKRTEPERGRESEG